MAFLDVTESFKLSSINNLKNWKKIEMISLFGVK